MRNNNVEMFQKQNAPNIASFQQNVPYISRMKLYNNMFEI